MSGLCPTRWIDAARLGLMALGAALALVTMGPTPAAEASPPRGSLLFVGQVGGGKLVRTESGAWRLRLTEVSPAISTFTDRPERRAGRQSVRRFVASWARYGFAADPPNAALVLDRARPSEDVAMLTLRRPHFDRRRDVLSFHVAPLRRGVGSDLARFAQRRDPLRARSFSSAALFVDGSETGNSSEPLTLKFTDIGEEETIAIRSEAVFGETRFENLKLTNTSGLPIKTIGGAGSSVLTVTTGVIAANQCTPIPAGPRSLPTFCPPRFPGFGGSFTFQITGTFTVVGVSYHVVQAELLTDSGGQVSAEIAGIGPVELGPVGRIAAAFQYG